MAAVSGFALLASAHLAFANEHGSVDDSVGVAVQSIEGKVVAGLPAPVTEGTNKLDDHSFKDAIGLFQINQNTGQNAAVQSGASVSAVVETPSSFDGGSDSASRAHNATIAKSRIEGKVDGAESLERLHSGDLEDVLSDYSGSHHGHHSEVESRNTITDDAFKNAAGIFNINQNTGANALVQSSIAVAATIRISGSRP
jgi:hypothetical protein